MTRRLLTTLPLLFALAACEQVNQRLGLEDPAKKEARQDGEGRAVGSACRQSGRAIEDCYAIYYWLPKASIFAGWREMNDYMLTNKLEVVQPRYEPPGSPEEMRKKRRKDGEAAAAAEADRPDKDGAKPAEKAADAAGDKSAEKTPEKPEDKPKAAEAKEKAEAKPESAPKPAAGAKNRS